MRISDWSSDVCSSDLVDAGDAQKDHWDVAVPFLENSLRANLGFGISPTRIDGRILIDALVGAIRRAMNQHRARVDELLDLETLQSIDQPSRTLDGNLLVERTGFTCNVVIGGEMDD